MQGLLDSNIESATESCCTNEQDTVRQSARTQRSINHNNHDDGLHIQGNWNQDNDNDDDLTAFSRPLLMRSKANNSRSSNTDRRHSSLRDSLLALLSLFFLVFLLFLRFIWAMVSRT